MLSYVFFAEIDSQCSEQKNRAIASASAIKLTEVFLF